MEIIGHCSLEALEIGLPSLLPPPRGSSWGSPYQHVVNPRVVDTQKAFGGWLEGWMAIL